VLIADYWWVRRTSLHLADLYKPSGVYSYVRGWNWVAVVALVIGIIFAIGGSYSGLNTDGTPNGPFPLNGILPFLHGWNILGMTINLADYSWVVGLIVSFLIYGIVTKVLASSRPAPSPAEVQPVA
jgi:NCS1 family nucleobase:cation symporter-1